MKKALKIIVIALVIINAITGDSEIGRVYGGR